MDIYGTKQIRNVVLLGHGGAGKTTVAEALAYLTGVTKRMGKVADGNTISDYDKEEIKRQFSISTTMVPIEYEGAEGKIKINLLDTPGYFDFVGEVEEAVSAADAAIIVVNCKAGIEVGTEKAWDLCEEYKLPRIIFVTNMDDDHASFRELILKLEKKFGRKIAPFQVPIRENEKFVGFVNAVKMQGRRFTNLSDYEDCEIPEYTKKNLGIIRDALIEAVAETKLGALRWIGSFFSVFGASLLSIGCPRTLKILPSVCSPTGTMIGPPVATASMPRTRPSVGPRAMHLTVSSPRCWATSTVRTPPSFVVISMASLISGSPPWGNLISRTALMT